MRGLRQQRAYRTHRLHRNAFGCAVTVIVTVTGIDSVCRVHDARAQDANHHVAADPNDAWERPFGFRAFPYTRPQNKHYFRAAIEVSAILIVGNVDYLLNTQERGGTVQAGDRRWDLRYDWPTFHRKLTGDLWRLDTNQFNTNYISHPFAGTLYYTAARSNHLNIFESAGYGVVGSLLWEYFGELREIVSVNDAIVTPAAGFAIGEPLMQLSGFFYRSRRNFGNQFFGALTAPLKAINDFADGATTARSPDTDEFGFTRDVWHRFELFLGAGMTSQDRREALDLRIGLHTELRNLPNFGSVASRQDSFVEGNLSELHFETTWSDRRIVDALFSTKVLPFGFYIRHVEPDGERLRGDTFLLGWLAGFEYGVHDYDRDRRRDRDLFSIVSPIGVMAEYIHETANTRLRTRVDVSGGFAGVRAYALNDYRLAGHDNTDLQSVLRERGYYHALGVSASPSIDFRYRWAEIGARFRIDSFNAVEGFDEQQEKIRNEVSLADRRIGTSTWMAVDIPSTRIRAEILGRRLSRAGEVGDIRASRDELSLIGTLAFVF